MQDAFERLSAAYCPNCQEDGLIEMYNVYNKPIGYRSMVKYLSKEETLDRIDHTELSYAKCIKCKKEFRIDWTLDLPRATTLKFNF